MDALHGLVPGLRGNQDNNQPAPEGNGWFRALREVVVDMYLPRGEDGARHMNRALIGTSISVVTAGCAVLVSMYGALSAYMNYSDDSDAVAKEEVQNRLHRMAAAGCVFQVSLYLFQRAIEEADGRWQEGQQFIERMDAVAGLQQHQHQD